MGKNFVVKSQDYVYLWKKDDKDDIKEIIEKMECLEKGEWIKELKESGKDLGVTAWIPKPLKKDALLGAVEKVIGRLTKSYARKTA